MNDNKESSCSFQVVKFDVEALSKIKNCEKYLLF